MSTKRVSGGVTAPKGFWASGIRCQIKPWKKRDLGLLVSAVPAKVVGALTTHRLASAPVLWSRRVLKTGQAQAILANSGNANACTGRRGASNTQQMASACAQALQVSRSKVLVASTGVIGVPLPIKKIVAGIPRVAQQLGVRGSDALAEAILTTDLKKKQIAVEISVHGKKVRIGGIAKGAGMIQPGMATMFAFLSTDANIHHSALRKSLKTAVDQTFNAISVDGQMSTSDSVFLLANGQAGNRSIGANDRSYNIFSKALAEVCEALAKAIVKDGEGVKRIAQVEILGAKSDAQAKLAARAVANSPLVKTMIAGADPNWGRVAAAIGGAGVALHPNRLTIALCKTPLFRKGTAIRHNAARLRRRFQKSEVLITVSLGVGRSSYRMWTGDLTEGYVRFNAKYTT